jgi:hypothetical protein
MVDGFAHRHPTGAKPDRKFPFRGEAPTWLNLSVMNELEQILLDPDVYRNVVNGVVFGCHEPSFLNFPVSPDATIQPRRLMSGICQYAPEG